MELFSIGCQLRVPVVLAFETLFNNPDFSLGEEFSYDLIVSRDKSADRLMQTKLSITPAPSPTEMSIDHIIRHDRASRHRWSVSLQNQPS